MRALKAGLSKEKEKAEVGPWRSILELGGGGARARSGGFGAGDGGND